MVEHTSVTTTDGSETVEIGTSVTAGAHVRPTGDDLAAGDEVLGAGIELTAAHLGLLATVGRTEVTVVKRPRVGVLSTGDELVADGAPLARARSATPTGSRLSSLCRQAGFEAVDLGLVRDDEAAIEAALRGGAAECDVLLTSGGVSMGDFDYVKAVLDRIGDMRWMQVAISPAKPLAFGLIGDVPVFGLPGNPVSSMVSFELFARPGIRTMAGHDRVERRRVRAVAEHDFKRQTRRQDPLRPGHGQPGTGTAAFTVRSSGGQGSHQLSAMATANALAVLHDGEGVAAGDSSTSSSGLTSYRTGYRSDPPSALSSDCSSRPAGRTMEVRSPTITRPTEVGDLVDSFGRVHRDLRISVTDRCNFRCAYCMPAEGMEWLPRRRCSPSRRSSGWPASWSSGSASTRSGSPAASRLMRAHLPVLVRKLARLGRRPGHDDQRVDAGPHAHELADAGLGRINISLDSLRRDRFVELTRRDELDSVLAGIDAAVTAGFGPVKVNVVMVRGVNDDEIVDFAAFGRDRGVIVRFIEFMPLDAQEAVGPRAGGRPRREIVEAIVGSVPARARRSGSSAGRAVPLPRRAGRGRRDPERHPAVLRLV